MASKTEHSSISSEMLQRGNKLQDDIKRNIDAVTKMVVDLTQNVNDGVYDTVKGISLLDLKNSTYLSYMSNLMYTTLLKLSGESLVAHHSIDRLIEQRVVFERLSPYERKLKHQIEKYLKADKGDPEATSSKKTEETAGLSVTNFAVGNCESEDEKQDDEDAGSKLSADGESNFRYRVPKVSQNKFPEDSDRNEKTAAARRRVLNSVMMQDALYEHSTDPDVIHNSNALQRRAQKKRDEIQRYEEENLTRIQVSKKDRALMKETNTAGQMHGELLGFCDVSLLNGGGGDSSFKKRKRSSSGGAGKKGKGKKGGKKRKH